MNDRCFVTLFLFPKNKQTKNTRALEMAQRLEVVPCYCEFDPSTMLSLVPVPLTFENPKLTTESMAHIRVCVDTLTEKDHM